MAKIKRIVTSEVEGRNLSDFYGDNSLAMETDGTINYYGANEMGPLIAPGIVYGANHDSGDGYGYNTIKLIPHAPGGDVYDNRYIIVDPTTPNHIHLRAGGTQDDSGVELILGGEKTNVVVDDSDKNVKINSKVQQQVMAHLNLNSESSEYLLTSDVVSATSNGWYAEVDGVRRYVADVTVGEGTLIYAPGASFAPNGVYNFFSPDYSNEWMFGTDGTFTGPGQNGTVKVNGLWGQDTSPLYLLGPDSVVLDGDGGEFLNDPGDPANQIATIGYVNEAIPGQALETTDSPSFNKILVTNNDGTANNVKIGDDAWIGDLNQADHIAVVGAQDPTNGGIILGNSGTETISADAGDLYITSGGAMTIEAVSGDMNFYMDGGMYIGDSNTDNQIIKRSDLNAVAAKTLPTGGTAGQVLSKVDGTDFNATWVDAAAGSSSTSVIKHAVKLGEAISKGQAVYVSSADGTNMIVSKASNATEAASSKTIGLIETAGILNDTVNVVAEGLLAGLDTSTATAGDPVWLGTDGNLIFGLANKPVAPAHLVFIGVVTRVNQNNGEIFVKVQNGFELNEIHNVLLDSDASIADHEVLAFDLASGLWKNQTASEAGLVTTGGAETLTNKTLNAPVITGNPTIYSQVLTGRTGTGNLVLGTSPTFTTSVVLPSTINATSSSTSTSLFQNLMSGSLSIAENLVNGNINIATSSTWNATINIASGGLTSGSKTINIGTGQGTGGATYITLGSSVSTSNINLLGSVFTNTIDGTSNTSSINLFGSTTIVPITIGNALTSGTFNIANGTSFSGTVNLASGGTASGTKTINIGSNGVAGSTTNVTIGTGTGATSNTYLNGRVIMPTPTVPGSATATGTAGQIAWDANYIYVCTATNTWKRTAISTW